MDATTRLDHRTLSAATPRHDRPLLLLHGAWHGAWCWDEAMRDFAARGFEVHALSLRGHGASRHPGPLNLVGLDDYLRDIEAVLDQIAPAPVVVGHSLGGFLLQHLVGRRQLPGAVLLCSLPPRGTFGVLSQWMLRHPGAALRAVATLDLRHLVGTPALAREAFFSPALPEQLVREYTARLGSESLRVALEAILRPPRVRPGATPMLVIGAERDALFPVATQHRLAAAWGVEAMIIPGAAHDLMLDPAWPQAAERIERAAAGWGARQPA